MLANDSIVFPIEVVVVAIVTIPQITLLRLAESAEILRQRFDHIVGGLSHGVLQLGQVLDMLQMLCAKCHNRVSKTTIAVWSRRIDG